MKYQIGIGLLGKGSTNHLHRQEVVDSFRTQGTEVSFLVREDYVDVLVRLEGCEYFPVKFNQPDGIRGRFLEMSGFIRRYYPSKDQGRDVNIPPLHTQPLRTRWYIARCRFFARYQVIVRLLVWLEGICLAGNRPEGIDPSAYSALLLLGVGTVNSELEGNMTWWARKSGLPVIHFIGNYDNLSSKGFRGVPVEQLLVWGKSMEEDAVILHGVPRDRITVVGSIRYNHVRSMRFDRDSYLEKMGLNPEKKTILFAGFVYEYHYFEILDLYKALCAEGEECQLILRVYPNKELLNSVYMEALLGFADNTPGVCVSLGDPHYRKGAHKGEVLQIEEDELMGALHACDVVINQYSTISVEACMFDKPAINMWYFPPGNGAMRVAPEYTDYSRLFHNRRMDAYDAIPRASSREQLRALLREALASPSQRASARAEVVQKEIGALDGHAHQRLVDACIETCQRHSNRKTG